MISLQVTWGLPHFATDLRSWLCAGHYEHRTDAAPEGAICQTKASVTLLGLEIELHWVWIKPKAA